ncbi:pre-mRNA-processing protein 45 [Dothidotthia symphoricarpi CBS 119687]|uniref:Pre-mRNA-processing protein 45 n=1 Tax=Dothidotthia symphoricarpi CBS 119687 TaxID=1392245 RepID=A0A6A6A3N2_9PLEO|nr:pre-mRNA-processing protein 45 [Dothidotthia symphoricarpi CBS 119687]KAF2125763.1 pre-mRNA-processing protein 45 [Dothidotthia symphoricarpi CBS 119687]
MSVATLSKSLPRPKYTGEEEELTKATRVLSSEQYETQVARRQNGPPPYGNRTNWRPRTAEDFGDGGAFPEVQVAQYPLDMGRKGTQSTSNALVRRVDGEGKTKYDEIARRGHSDSRIVQASFKDLIPLRQQANAGELDLDRPSQEVVQATKEKTEAALMALVSGQTTAQRPKNVQGRKNDEPTFVRYTPTAQMGEAQGKTRIFKIQQRQIDPLEPPKFKHKRIPRGPPSPPPPILHSPPRKLTAEDQEMWKIPPPISNWKNPKGYTVPLDKRLAADGRGLQDITINDKFAQFGEALQAADRHAREEVKQRAIMQQRLAEKEKLQKEDHLRNLAKQAREERANASRRRSDSESDSEEEAVRQRTDARRERREDFQRELRQSRMGTERKIQMLAREQNRDISEKVALGLAKPTQGGESMYDSRLFNQSSGFNTGFNEDNHYDKPLFAAQDAISSIYRPSVQQDDGEDDGATYDKITKTSKFEVLGKAKEGFKGADTQEAREGPVQFEKDTDDPFNINQMIEEVKGEKGAEKTGEKRYGIQEMDGRAAKRARVEDDSD